jgi:signal transduction histidine kinase
VTTTNYITNNIRRSIRLQLIVAFIICLLSAMVVYAVSKSFFGEINRNPIIDYSEGISRIDFKARMIVDNLKNDHNLQSEPPLAPPAPDGQVNEHPYTLQAFLDDASENGAYQILLLDLDGKVLYKSKNASETQVDVHQLIAQAMDSRGNTNQRQEVHSLYPVDFQNKKMYLVTTGIPQPSVTYTKGTSPLTLLFAAAAFIFLFYRLSRQKMRDVEALAEGLNQISKGNLQHRVLQKSEDELGTLAGNINRMTEELQRTIEEERNAERTKNELITNVSHDLRTPLTLVIGYLRLLKDKNYEDEAQADTYLNIAYNKSDKLNRLIEDLFDYTKYSNHSVPMQLERVCLNELIEQLLEEQITYAEENSLTIVRELPAQKLFVSIDADQMIRVFENLLINAIKYSDKPGLVTLRLIHEYDHALITIINQASTIDKEELPHVFDRFYRLDAARTSTSGGSGLGLAIAKSIVEAHDGEIWTKTEQDEIHFCLRLKLV